jgi:NodT family efflux transporter outer membrane factor (OMF) lipoprotein
MVRAIRLRSMSGLSMLLSVGACVGVATAPVATPQPEVVSGAWQSVAPASQPLHGAPWWQALQAPPLQALIGRALAANTDLATAAARVRQAAASADAALASGRPTLALNTAAERQNLAKSQLPRNEDGSRPSSRRRQFGLDAVAAYELDWLGRNALALSAAQAEQGAAEQDAAAARITLTAAVVETYAEACWAEQQAQLSSARRAQAAVLSEAEERRLSAGLVARSALNAGFDTATRAQLDLEDAQRRRQQALGRLAVLLGEQAHQFEAGPLDTQWLQPLADRIALPASDQPADVIGRRPDVQAAWQRLLAAHQDSERAQLERYPRITLTASTGLLAESLRGWLRGDALGWLLGLRGSVPLWDGGRIAAQSEQARAQRGERQAEYRRVVLTALQEVEGALTDFEATRLALGHAQALRERRRQEEQAARREQGAGRRSRGSVAEAALLGLQAQDEWLRAQRAHLTSFVSLHRVLASPLGNAPWVAS